MLLLANKPKLNAIGFRTIILLSGFILSLMTNIQASPLKSDEEVIFFSTIGYPAANGVTWELHIHGWVYEPQWDINIFIQKNTWLNLEVYQGEETTNSIFKQRAGAFFVDNEGGKQIAIRMGHKHFTLNKSGGNGHFFDLLRLPAADIDNLRKPGNTNDFIPFETANQASDSRPFKGEIQLIDGEGLSIISDIDDTIKISEVNRKASLLANTFVRPFQAVPKMANRYQTWAKQGNVTFHYVSASPWQLYQPLADFLADKGFPMGSFHLRLFRWKDGTFFDFFKSSRQHKIETIQSLIACCRQRYFILVGDSGEQDPEIYASIARQYPQRIAHIFIRDVTEEDENAKRYQKTFNGLPESLWTLFRETTTLETDLSQFLPKPEE